MAVFASNITRRGVVAGAAAVGLGFAGAQFAAGTSCAFASGEARATATTAGNDCTPTFLESPEAITDFAETKDFDVVVVGAGASGLAAAMRGAEVTLIHGETALPPVRFTTDVPVTTAQQMYEAVTSRFEDTDVLIMAAAVADYRPASVAADKIKKKDGDMSIPLERTPDILGTIGPKKTRQFLCGFSMETRDLVENSSAKLAKKNLDMVVANNLKVAGAGFGVDTNVVTFITPDGTRELPLMSKSDVADAILDEILKRRSE